MADEAVGVGPAGVLDPDDVHALLAEAVGQVALIGAGTVTTSGDVRAVCGAGGRLIVSPNTDADVIVLAVNTDGRDANAARVRGT